MKNKITYDPSAIDDQINLEKFYRHNPDLVPSKPILGYFRKKKNPDGLDEFEPDGIVDEYRRLGYI